MTEMNVKKLKPTAGYILVQPAEAKQETASGIILSTEDGEKPQYGQVLAVGAPIYDDGKEILSPVKVGTQVLYKKWGGNEVKIGEIEYQILKFEDILATIK